MDNRDEHIQQLFAAELQFRLASAVRLAARLNRQPLDLPTEWSHGQHRVQYDEIALREDQAEYAAAFLHQSATLLMSTAILNAIRSVDKNPKDSNDEKIVNAYQIARMIRNAFSHAPFSPKWSIDEDCRDKIFCIPYLIKVDTVGLQGKSLDWRHYGGPLALFRLCRFTRVEILKDSVSPRSSVPAQNGAIYQQGDLILRQVADIPTHAVEVAPERLEDGSISLGNGHFVRIQPKGEK